MYCDVKWISAFFVLFVQPLPGGVMHSYVLSGFAREASAHRATVVDSIPFTHPAHVPALLELLRHQCAINTLLRSCVTSQGAGTGGRFIYFLTSWHLWKMDELGQEKWKRVSNQMLFFFLMVQFVTCTMKSCQSLRPASLWPSTDLTATPSLSVSISCKIFNEAQVWL